MFSRNLSVLDFVRRFFVSCAQISEAYVGRTSMKFGCDWRKIGHKSKCRKDSERTLNKYGGRRDSCLLSMFIENMMLGSKGILTPLIPNCYVLCTLAILKTFVIRSFFFKKWLLAHVFGGSQVQKSSCKQACIGFMTF